MRSVDASESAPDGALAFTHDGSTLVATERGEGGRALVLLHGLGMGASIFEGLVGELDGVRTIAIDLPGYGNAPEPRRTPSVERMADLIAAFLRDRGEGPADVLGHSLGSQIALEVAVRHPSVVHRVVLVAPTVDPRARTVGGQARRLAWDLLDEAPRVFVRGGREYLRAGPRIGRKMRAMLVHRPEASFARLRRPALVLRGENDPVSPRDWCEFVVSEIPDARMAEVPDHGHETMIRDAAPAARYIAAFLEDGRDQASSSPV